MGSSSLLASLLYGSNLKGAQALLSKGSIEPHSIPVQHNRNTDPDEIWQQVKAIFSRNFSYRQIDREH